MDYVDYKGFMKLSWEKAQKSHHDRLQDILALPSNRIDNKPSEFHKKAPCKKKPKKINREKLTEDLKLIKSLKDILERDYKKELKQRIGSVNNLKAIPKRFKPYESDQMLIKQNQVIQGKLNRVKSNFSKKSWDKDFKESKAYSKIRSKPHLDQKLPSLSPDSPLSRRTLMDSNSLSIKLFYP